MSAAQIEATAHAQRRFLTIQLPLFDLDQFLAQQHLKGYVSDIRRAQHPASGMRRMMC
jgi:hypothetical protein